MASFTLSGAETTVDQVSTALLTISLTDAVAEQYKSGTDEEKSAISEQITNSSVMFSYVVKYFEPSQFNVHGSNLYITSM